MMQAESAVDRFALMREVYSAAVAKAPGLRDRFAEAGLSPRDLLDETALNRLPVLKKERLVDMQRASPPFAGFLAAEPHELAYVFVSPGPIFEPSLAEDAGGHGMDRMFAAAGVGPGDLALNTWSYHLVPAGLLFDKGLRAVGAAVVPGGIGASELQADLLIKLGITAFLGSTAFFLTLIERLEQAGHRLPESWALKHAFLGGELGDWAAKRRTIEQRYGLKTWSCYATADFGLIGYEVEGDAGYRIHSQRYVQICDPGSGTPLPAGELGEIVVTTLARGWPMIRFGTGDLTRAVEIGPDGGVVRIALLEGRTGGAVKAREIFLYPSQLGTLLARVPKLERIALIVSRPANRDVVTARIVPAKDAIIAELEAELRAAFAAVTRLQIDRIECVASAEAFGEPLPIADER